MAYIVLQKDPYASNPKWSFCRKFKTESQASRFIHSREDDYDETEYIIKYPGPSGYPNPKKFNNPNNQKYFGREYYYIKLYKLNNYMF